MRDLILSKAAYTESEKRGILAYCESDVTALGELFVRMAPDLDVPRALLRGNYMKCVAHMEHTGIPIDVSFHDALARNWDVLQSALIRESDSQYGVYEGETFKAARWLNWTRERGISWPRLESGAPALDDETFKEQALVWADVAPMRELRRTLSQMRSLRLPVGPDGRSRCLLSPFASKTGRNQPSTSKFTYGQPAWLRSLVRPQPGWGLAHIDWSQQELGINAALAGDDAMMLAYQSGDFYIAFAQMARAVPKDATKESHPRERQLFKTTALGVLYGMSEFGLARRLDAPQAQARRLLQLHQRIFHRFWDWVQGTMDFANLHRYLKATFGWQLRVNNQTKPRTIQNFLGQANGAEMLRIACCLLTEQGIRICAPIHDALVVEAPLEELDDVAVATQKAMQKASEVVLAGFPLRTDVKLVKYPDRYVDERGAEMLQKVQRLLATIDEGRG